MASVEMHGISKKFGDKPANENVELRADKGEITALVGENGAGKTTLMKILYGMYSPDSGKIFINGKEERIENPSKAIKLGIGMVHQHFMLIPPLTVTENIILGNEPTGAAGTLNLKKAEKKIKELSDSFGISIDPSAKVENLSVGMEQRAEILKLLYRKAEILILDEPTAVLTPQETDELFTILKKLKEEGKTIIIISHKLNEIFAVSDRITVMRRGRNAGDVKTSESSKEEISRMITGAEIKSEVKKENYISDETVLSAENLSAEDHKGIRVLKNVSLEIKKGEILGIAGVEGNGQRELIEILTGLRNSKSGNFKIKGGDKISHIPEDRIKRGIVPDLKIYENILLGRQNERQFRKGILINREAAEKYTDELIKEYDVRPTDRNALAKELSGGNQQKVVTARELSKGSEVIIVNHPSRGLDIAATEFVHTSIINERNKGKGILLVSSDLQELLKLSDRIAVMYNGEIRAEYKAGDVNERELGRVMTGLDK
jgi:simple sugar transport system ATP-binding protein